MRLMHTLLNELQEGASLSRLGFSAAPFARSSADCYDVCEHDEDDDFYDYDDDYDIIAARVSRKVISNRKFGSGGVLQAGRLQARPVNNSNNGKGEENERIQKAAVLIAFQLACVSVCLFPSAVFRWLIVVSQV